MKTSEQFDIFKTRMNFSVNLQTKILKCRCKVSQRKTKRLAGVPYRLQCSETPQSVNIIKNSVDDFITCVWPRQQIIPIHLLSHTHTIRCRGVFVFQLVHVSVCVSVWIMKIWTFSSSSLSVEVRGHGCVCVCVCGTWLVNDLLRIVFESQSSRGNVHRT